MKGKLILFSGPSGVGKGTVREIFFKNKDLKLEYSISYTTRKKRENETDGVDYFFVSEEKFKKLIDQNSFLEWAIFNKNYYGTSIDFINNILNKGKNVLLEIDVEGVKQILKSKFKNFLTIFLLPPSLEELEKRLLKRKTETKELIAMRLKRAKDEIPLAKLYQFQVVNDDVNLAAEKISKIILNNS